MGETNEAIPVDPEAFAAEIMSRRAEWYRGKERTWPRTQPVASDLDPDSCARRQVLNVVAWESRAPIPGERLPRLEVGDILEDKTVADLKAWGFEVIEGQVPFEIKDRRGVPCVRGKIDAKIAHRRLKIPVEVKSCASYVFDSINTIEDLGLKWWTRRYPAQLMMYLLGYAAEWGLLILRDLAGRMKIIVVRLDMEVAEKILRYAEAAVLAIEANRSDVSVLPPYSKDAAECVRCDFYGRVCNPDLSEAGAVYVQDPELEADLLRREEIASTRKEYETIDKRVKEGLKKGPAMQVVGSSFMVTIKEYGPENKRSKRVDIQRIGKTSGEDEE